MRALQRDFVPVAPSVTDVRGLRVLYILATAPWLARAVQWLNLARVPEPSSDSSRASSTLDCQIGYDARIGGNNWAVGHVVSP